MNRRTEITFKMNGGDQAKPSEKTTLSQQEPSFESSHYIISGVFSQEENATQYLSNLTEEDRSTAGCFYEERTGCYYGFLGT
ncbi:hypothetical protein [Echinicola vietnamensis]|uniref:hypothetical protein n=1 Tax=Echinicola vietnamensis TaxID=390884 RepID=UPI0012FB472A|nr:hypothetical protein [Echinicola vietnamensis]